ncbi:MAG: ATP synthase F1 subunit epsilon [Planctomycetota bacterium]|jgi:F-type H+-transporting ATPase subunit epsilon
MAQTVHCSIVTPTETVFDDHVTYASFPAWDGQHGVMVGQSPLLTKLGYGSLRLDFTEGGSRWYLIEGGFAEIKDNRLNLLTEQATPAEQLSLKEAEAELAEAQARVTQSAEDRAKVERDQQRALAKAAVARAASARGGAI